MESEEQKLVQKAVVKYANKLVTHDIAKMSPLAQNLLSYLFSIWTFKQETNLSIDLNDLKNQLCMNDQREKALATIIERIATEIINKSLVSGYDDDGNMYASSLIYHFQIHAKQRTLEVRATPEFVSLFGVKNNYVRYNLLTFYSIKSKQGKNLYRLFCRYYKGHFTADWEELRAWMGYKTTTENRNIILAIKNAQKYLLEHKYLEKCEITPIYSPRRGHPIQKIHFEYTFSQNSGSAKIADKSTPESPENGETPPPDIEIPTYTKDDKIPLFNETAAPENPPIDFSKITAVPPKNIKLPDISDLHLPPQKKEEKQPKPLIHHCIYCGKEMVIRKNGKTGAYFFACPERGHQTITMTTEEYRKYMENKNSV